MPRVGSKNYTIIDWYTLTDKDDNVIVVMKTNKGQVIKRHMYKE